MKQKLYFGVALAALAISGAALIAPTAAYAQETTSAISGQVTDENGAPINGASIVVVHVPSGTTSTSTTDSTGSFSLRGLRVGGPYTVKADAQGFADHTVQDISLTIGDTLAVPIKLESVAIVVTAQRSGSRQTSLGSQSVFSSSQIQDIVSARRDVRDIVRRDPLAAYNPNIGGVSIAGGNIRTQRFSVDGVQMQDSFGLNYGGLPSTRGIISIEAIDQLTVKAAPFDVSEGNFQGGAVNVVMKSGTNRFHASAFGNWGNASLTGKRTRDNRGLVGDIYPVSNTTILPFKSYGGSISGPIIKDKLFFAGAYEYLAEGSANTYGIAGSSAPNIVPGLTQAAVDNVITRFGAAGYAPYTIGTIPTSISEVDKKYSAKLDWNVTSGQRFSFSYIHHENTLPNFGTGAATGSSNSQTPYIQLQSNQYKLTEFTNAFAGQLNSQWSDNLSSEIRVANKYYRRGQEAYFGPDYAQFAVCTDAGPTAEVYSNVEATRCAPPLAGVASANGIVRLGPDTARQANKFSNKQWTVNSNLQLKAGDHTFKLEADYFNSQIYNLFSYGGSAVSAGGTGGANGAYYFDSLDQFSNRQANEFVLTSATTGNKNDAYVNWQYTMYTFGLQDTWRPSTKFTATLGARFDMYGGDKVPSNPGFGARYGFSNIGSYNGLMKLQPRFGFNWATTPRLRISGGAGLFAGGLSDVFISNNFSNSGVALNSTGATIASIDILRNGGTPAAPTCTDRANPGNVISPALCAAALTGFSGAAVPTLVSDYLKTITSSGSVSTNSLDPNFKIPAQWKLNLSANWAPYFGDSALASGWNFRADVLYSKAQQAIRWIDLRDVPLVIGGVTQVAPDGRPRYAPIINGSNSDIQLTNTTQGYALVLAGAVSKQIGPVNLSASYTHQDVRDVSGILTSSTVSSSYGVVTRDPNGGGVLGRSAFEVTHTFRANLDFKHKFFGDNETRFGINWELRSGQPFSLTMNDNTSAANGRALVFGTTSNTSSHLLYVPDFSQTPTATSVVGQVQYGKVIFANQATADSLKALVTGTALRNYQGKIMPKGILTGPWYNKVDLNFAQQIPLPFHSKVTALFSIENFLNLLNRDWGTYQDFGVSQTVVNVTCQTPAPGAAQSCPNYVYSNYAAPKTQSYSKPSLYAIRAGVRFDF